MEATSQTTASLEAEEAQEGTWQPQEAKGEGETQGTGGKPVIVPGRNGGLIRAPWTPETSPRSPGRPKGPDAWAALARLKKDNAPRWAQVIDDILCHPEQYPKVYGTVLKEYGERLLGPVERTIHKEERKVSVSAYVLPQGATGGALETARGPGNHPLPGAVGMPVVALPSPVGLVESQGGVGGHGDPIGSPVPPASSGLEARMGALEGQVGQMMEMLRQLVGKVGQ